MYLGIPPFGQTVRTVTTITASASQTAFTPTGGYVVGYVDVYYNGVRLVDGDDYTATNGSTVTLTTAANAGDSVELVSYMPVSLADTYRQAEADLRFVNVTGDTMSGVHRHNTYLSIGKGPNNNDQITFNAVPDNSGNYTPVWTGNSSAGGSIIGMNSGGNGGLVIRSLRFGTNSSPQAESAYPIRWQMTDDGKITMPYQPAFFALKNSSAVESSFTSAAVVTDWASPSLNVGSHFNNSTGRFVAPVSGRYFFSFNAMHSGQTVGDVQFRWYRNGSLYAGSNHTATGGTWAETTVTCLMELSAGDYAEPWAYSGGSGGSGQVLVYSGSYSHVSGYLLG